MIDAEVARLRRLRDVALWTRSMAASLDVSGRRTSIFARSARTGWTIARAVTGRLRAHPYLSYQQDASAVRTALDSVGAGVIGFVARRRGRSVSTCLEQMHSMARELDDARAVTWSPDLSDTLGRVQLQVRRLIAELEAGARQEVGAARTSVVATAKTAVDVASTDWPYLAI